MNKILAFLVSAIVSVSANAGDVWGSLMTVSHHSDRSQKYNEFNPGLGLELPTPLDSVRLVAGRYKNSYSVMSNYAGVTVMPLAIGNDVTGQVKAGVLLSGVTGYAYTGKKIAPMVAGVMTFERAGNGFNVLAVPPGLHDENPTWIFALQLKHRF